MSKRRRGEVISLSRVCKSAVLRPAHFIHPVKYFGLLFKSDTGITFLLVIFCLQSTLSRDGAGEE